MFTKDSEPGYVRNVSTTSTTHQIFQNHSSPKTDTQPGQRLDVTDITKGVKFSLPNTQVAAIDISKPVADIPTGAGDLRTKVDAAEASYLNVNQVIMDTIMKTFRKVDPEGQAVFNALAPPDTSAQLVNAAVNTIVPTGAALNIYSMINQAAAESNKPGNSKINEVLTKGLAELHKINQSHTHAFQRAASPNPLGLDFSAMKTIEDLKNFVGRNVKDDRFMKEAKQARQNCDQMDANKALYDNHYTDVATDEKLALAVAQGKVDVVRDLTDNETQAQLAMAGAPLEHIELYAKLSSGEITASTSRFLPELSGKGIKLKGLESLSGGSDKARLALNLEPDPRTLDKASPTTSFNATMS